MRKSGVLSHESLVKFILILSLLLIGLYLVRVGTNFVAYAQSCPNNNLASGLVTALTDIQGLGNLQSICATGSGVHIDLRNATYNVETYENIFNNYFNGSGVSISKVKIDNQPDYRINTDSYSLFHINSDLNITPGSISGSEPNFDPNNPIFKPTMVFVQGNLNILSDINYANPIAGNPKSNIGLVFIVKGKINISSAVSNINAVLVAQGDLLNEVLPTATHSICTACAANGQNNSRRTISPTQFDNSLVINGSLIALNRAYPITFNRQKENNTDPSEIINGQVKYMIILKDLITQPFQRFVEL